MLSADVCLFGHTWLKIDLFYVKSQLKFYEKSNQALTNESNKSIETVVKNNQFSKYLLLVLRYVASIKIHAQFKHKTRLKIQFSH